MSNNTLNRLQELAIQRFGEKARTVEPDDGDDHPSFKKAPSFFDDEYSAIHELSPLFEARAEPAPPELRLPESEEEAGVAAGMDEWVFDMI